MDATCTIQDSIHVFNLVHKYVSRILGTYHSFRGFSFSNDLTQFDRTKPLLTRFLWVKWWTTTPPKEGL